MGVQHSTGLAKTNNRKVQERLSRWPAVTFKDIAFAIDLQYVTGHKRAFVDAARSDREPEWIAADDRAEVAACAEDPAAAVKIRRQPSKVRSQ